MTKIILAVAMLSAVVVSNVARADGYEPGDYFDARGGVTAGDFGNP